MATFSAAFGLMALTTFGALAQDASRFPPCTCRGKAGADMPLGAQICLATPGGPRLATCVMALNNTSWAPSEEICPVTSMARPTRHAMASRR